MKTERLKRCPFCGGQAKTTIAFDGVRVSCTECPATMEPGGTSPKLAIMLWNRRAAKKKRSTEQAQNP